MYSPKIAEDLIPILYRIRKARKIPMTRLVDSILREALGRIPQAAQSETAPELGSADTGNEATIGQRAA